MGEVSLAEYNVSSAIVVVVDEHRRIVWISYVANRGVRCQGPLQLVDCVRQRWRCRFHHPAIPASTWASTYPIAVRLPGVGVDLQTDPSKRERLHGVLRSAQGAAVRYRVHWSERVAKLLRWKGSRTIAAAITAIAA